MSIKHCAPGDIIDLGLDSSATTSATLIRERHIEVFRYVLREGQSTPVHAAAGACTIQCLEGEVELTIEGRSQSLRAHSMVYLKEDEPHAVSALVDTILLVTILLKRE